MRSSVVIVGTGLLLSASLNASAPHTGTHRPPSLQPPRQISDREEDRRLLAGEWEYEECTVSS
jgi:hypothetical protein